MEVRTPSSTVSTPIFGHSEHPDLFPKPAARSALWLESNQPSQRHREA